MAEPADAEPSPGIVFPLRIDIRSVALTGLFCLAVGYTLFVAKSFVVPLIVALLLSLLFSPLVRRLRRARVPEWLSAAAILLVLMGTVGGALYSLTGPASSWLGQAPAAVARAESKLKGVLRPLQRVSQTADQVEAMTEMKPPGDRTLQVEIREPGLVQVVFGNTQNVLGGLIIVGVMLYFLLASGDLFLTKLIKMLPRLADKKRAVQIARETEDSISSYLVAVTVVNVALGVAVGLAMWALGMPNPALWGVLAALTNYVPYVGAVAMILILGLVGLLHFDTLGQAALVPAAFLVLNFLESYIFTPRFVGQRLSLNPVVIFTGVLFWGWIWGIMGGLLAVPILATLKIACDHVQQLRPLGEFLGD